MNLIIVGAGAGVELAGSFAELRNDVFTRDYPKVDFSKLPHYFVGEPVLLRPVMGDDL